MKKKHATAIAIFLLGSIVTKMAFSTENNVSPMQMLANKTPLTTNSTTPLLNTPLVVSSQTPAVSSVIDCNYVISEPLSEVSADTIVQWANYSAVKTFSYDFQNYDKQFKELKQCYTTVGWESFVEAMKTSKNLKAVQDEHLFVSAKINGQSQLTRQSNTKEQTVWIVRIPLNVSYQNQDREVSQDIYVDLTIKTIYGSPVHLGINQIIASPKSGHELS